MQKTNLNGEIVNNKSKLNKNDKIPTKQVISGEFNNFRPSVSTTGDNKLTFNVNIKNLHSIPFVKFLKNKENILQGLRISKNTLEINCLLKYFFRFFKQFLNYFWDSAQQKIINNKLLMGNLVPIRIPHIINQSRNNEKFNVWYFFNKKIATIEILGKLSWIEASQYLEIF